MGRGRESPHTMRKALALWLLFWSVACFGSRNLPKPDDCNFPSQNADVRGLEIGYLQPFTSFEDGDAFQTTMGGQGSTMFMMAIRMEEGPNCLPQSTVLTDEYGSVVGDLDTPLKTYEEGRYRITEEIPILLHGISYDTREIRVQTTVNGKTTKRLLLRPERDSGDTGGWSE